MILITKRESSIIDSAVSMQNDLPTLEQYKKHLSNVAYELEIEAIRVEQAIKKAKLKA